MVKALGKSATTRSIVTCGKSGNAKLGSRPAKRVPIVSVSMPNSATTAPATTTAIKKPGQPGR